MTRQIPTFILWALIFSAIAYFIILNVPPILGVGHEALDQRRALERGWLIVHLSFGVIALILGAFQFWPGIRNKYTRWHRNAGKAYIFCSIITALMAFYLLSNYPLPGSVIAFTVLNLIWISTTILAWLFIRQREITLHQQFMTRSYVCALAFVFVRLLFKLNDLTGVFNFIKDGDTRDTLMDAMGWIFPVMITEFLLTWWPAIKKLRVGKEGSNVSP